jgi:hypothetical protein
MAFPDAEHAIVAEDKVKEFGCRLR